MFFDLFLITSNTVAVITAIKTTPMITAIIPTDFFLLPTASATLK
jgi:hypothetical protein